MTVDEVVEIREEAKRLLSARLLRVLEPEMGILEPVGMKQTFSIGPRNELSVGVTNEPVVGSTVEDAARIVRRAVVRKKARV